jgi:acetylornithine aminotransferase
MTGYRSGFVCAPPEIVTALRAFRPTVGTAPQEFVQRASIAAWSDERHVEEVREVYGRKRDVLLPALERQGIMLAGSAATFYLWVDVGGPSEPFARRLLEHGIVCAPGAFFGPAGEGYARFALVPTQAECERAAEIIGRVL